MEYFFHHLRHSRASIFRRPAGRRAAASLWRCLCNPSGARGPTSAARARASVRRVKIIQDWLDNEQEATRRGCSCETDSLDVRRHLGTVLIFSFLDFAIGFEIDHCPAIEFRGDLLKGKIDYPLYEHAIVAIMLDGCFPSEGLGSCRSLQQMMLEGTADCRKGSVDLCGVRTYEPCIGLRYRADFISARVKIHSGEHGMN